MFKIDIISAENGTLAKSKIYRTQSSLDTWLPKMAEKYCSIGNNIIVFEHLTSGWVSIPDLYKESTRT